MEELVKFVKNNQAAVEKGPLPEGFQEKLKEVKANIELFRKISEEAMEKEPLKVVQPQKGQLSPQEESVVEQSTKLVVDIFMTRAALITNLVQSGARAIKASAAPISSAGKEEQKARKKKFRPLGGTGWKRM